MNKNTNLTFGLATKAAEEGKRIARTSWNVGGAFEYLKGGQFVYLVAAGSYPAQSEAIKGVFPNDMVPYRAYWALKTLQQDVTTWVPSGSDTLARDWYII